MENRREHSIPRHLREAYRHLKRMGDITYRGEDLRSFDDNISGAGNVSLV